MSFRPNLGLWALPAALLISTASCKRDAPAPQAEAAQAATASETKPALQIKPIDLEGYRQAIRSHKGKVVLVDFWATWCAPCVESFPKIARLHRELGPQGLVVLSVSVDAIEEKDGKVRKFLQTYGGGFETYILDVQVFDDFIAAVNEKWMGQIPAMFLYDRTGKLRREFYGVGEVDEVERAIRSMPAETP